MSIDAGPGIIDAIWGKTKQTPIRKSDALQQQIDLTSGRLPGYRAAQDLSLSDYANALKGIGGDVKKLSEQDIGIYGNLLNQNQNYNPTANYQGLGDYLTGLVDKRANLFADINRGSLNMQRANLYGGQGGGTATGSYDKNLLWNNIARNLAPVYQTALAGITPAFQATDAARLANIGNTTNLVNQRAQIPFRTADLNLLPAEARSKFFQDEIAALSGLGGAVNQNLAGFRSDNNAVRGAMNAVSQSENDAQDLAMKAAAAYFGGGVGGMAGMAGGGGGGGGFGSFMGGGGRGAGGMPQGFSPYYNPYQQMPYNPYPYQQYPYPPYYNPGPSINTPHTTPAGQDPFAYIV